jgi:anti-anti-sigma factor
MPQASPVPSSSSGALEGTPFLCTLAVGGRCAAWVHVAGELDLVTSPQLAGTLAEARLGARLVVLDAREVTFVDSSGVHVISDASKACEHDGGRLMVVPSAALERILAIAHMRGGISTFDLSPDEPPPTLRLVQPG